MDRNTFTQNIDPNNPLDCYSNLIKTKAKAAPTPNKFWTKAIFHGKTQCEQLDAHHIYPKMLFPLSSAGGAKRETLRIIVSQDRHLKLHRLLAEEKYAQYENAIKAESGGQITDPIAQNILNRIAQI